MEPKIFLQFLVYAVCFAFVTSDYDVELTARQNDPNAVMGGKLADPDDYPWQVRLTYNKQFICGGTLLSKNIVLTAAHCAEGALAKKMRAILGDYDMRKKEKKPRKEKSMKVKKIIMHPNYDPDTLDNDIAILMLKGKAKFSDTLTPIPRIALPGETFIDNECFVSGWGVYEPGSDSVSRYLRDLLVPVIENDECYPDDGIVSDNMLCAYVENKGACFGDSGGPLQCVVDGEFVLTGVVSWGTSTCQDGPSVFARVSYYHDWIQRYI